MKQGRGVTVGDVKAHHDCAEELLMLGELRARSLRVGDAKKRSCAPSSPQLDRRASLAVAMAAAMPAAPAGAVHNSRSRFAN